MRSVRPRTSFSGPPRVSVVVPCFNYGHYLPDAVGSVLAQDGVDLDVTIVDDASTDDSVEVAGTIAAADARVRLVRHSVNRGHVETANHALELASAELVVKLDADDMLTPGSLARSAALMGTHPDVAFCYGYGHQFRGDPPTDTPTGVRSWTLWPGQHWVTRVLRRGHNPICQPEVMMRREALRESGGYRPQLRWAEDYNLWLRLALLGSVGRVNGPTQGLYRMHPQSFTQSAADREATDIRARVSAVELFLDECGHRLARPTRVRKAAIAALVRNARQAGAEARDRPGLRATYQAIAAELHGDDRPPLPGLSEVAGPVGVAYRDLSGRVRWRMWRRYGL